MKHLKLAHKIMVLCLLTILVFSAAISWVYLRVRANLYQGKQAAVQNAVDTSWSMVASYVAREKAGELDRTSAQTQAKEALRAMRFEGNNYFWINDLQPAMVMHPIKPELDGKNLGDFKDPNGKKLFEAMADLARSQQAGFVDYQWAKPGGNVPVDKLSYIRLVPEWGWVVGAGLYIDDIKAELATIFWRTLGIVLAAMVGAFGLALVVARCCAKPLNEVIRMMQGMGRGDLDSRLRMDRRDEIGVMAREIDAFADNLRDEVLAAFQRLAKGDFTFRAQGLIRDPLAKANSSLNSVIAEVITCSSQVATGSQQVADTSVTLSQGASEAAASLENINAVLTEVSQQTRQNAERARQADKQAATVRTAAENGSVQMEHMTAAMADISKAGEDISRIIKVIDEIAFQTNLLALNAAVEAARAGQHGKGFAVVAEEVRNLAGRSAKAAQETAQMIEDTVAKTTRGSQIANDTSASFQAIVDGVQEVVTLVSGIAEGSGDQARRLAEVNEGLDQIDQVVQLNTASAEESAAAAEELSSQAQLLKQMMAQFILDQERVRQERQAQAAPAPLPQLATA